MQIIKRDGQIEPYDNTKIKNAIHKAFKHIDCQVTDKTLTRLTAIVDNKVKNNMSVDEIQQQVELTLSKSKYKEVARAYIEYRTTRDNERRKTQEMDKTIQGLVDLTDTELLENNANKDANVIPVQRDMVAGVVAKDYALHYMLPESVAKAHEEGYIHVHDLDYSPFFPMYNCMLINVAKMMKEGFHLGNATIETPNSIAVACSVVAQIIAQVSSHIYGGNTINGIDEILEPYVKKSFTKHFKNGVKYLYGEELPKSFKTEYADEESKNKYPKAWQYAKDLTIKEVYDGCQSLEYEINTLFSANGQTPFTTFGFGLATSWEGKEIQKGILKNRIKGLGAEGKTPVFPKLVYVLKDGLNLNPTDPNYDIKQLALECSSKRLYPDILMYDNIVKFTGSFKFPMGCLSGDTLIQYYLNDIIHVDKFEEMWQRMSEIFEVQLQPDGKHEYIKLNNVLIRDKDNFVECKGIIRNTTKEWHTITAENGIQITTTPDHPMVVNGERKQVRDIKVNQDVLTADNVIHKDIYESVLVTDIEVTKLDTEEYSYDVTTASDTFMANGLHSHNCRSFLGSYEEDGQPIHDGRFNLGVITLNLPKIALESKQTKRDFYDILDEQLEVCKTGLLYRIDRLRGVKAKVAPILYTKGAVGVDIDREDVIDELLNNDRNSISLGYIGLHETILALYGEKMFGNNALIQEAQNIMIYMNNKLEEWKQETGNAFSLYGTPSESLCYRFEKVLKEQYGEIPNITDKNWITNSFHLDVEEECTAFDKIDFESKFQPLSTGGFISYVETNSMVQNPKALEALWDYAYDKIGYFAINTPSDMCFECGFKGEFTPTENGFECPNCGNHNSETCSCIRRVSGYLTEPSHRAVNKGKHDEMASRYKHY